MATSTPTRRRRKRGYVLLEVALGGIMASVVVGNVLEMIGSANDRSVVAARLETAGMLAEQGIEQARVEGAGLTDGSNVDVGVPSGLSATYTRTRTVTSGTDSVSDLTLAYKSVTVTVTFPNRYGTKTVTLTTRVYA